MDGERERGIKAGAGERGLPERDPVAALQRLTEALADHLAGGGLVLVEEVAKGEAGEQRVGDRAGADAEGNQKVLSAARVFHVAGLPLGAAVAGAGVGLREEDEGALGAGVSLGDAARDGAGEILVLEPVGVPLLGQRAGEPACPGPVGSGEADEEVALAIRGVGHLGCRYGGGEYLLSVAPYHDWRQREAEQE